MKKWMLGLAAAAVGLTTLTAFAGDWDAVIQEYETIVDKVIAVNKKVQAGDYNAASELAPLSQKSQELSAKIAAAAQTGLTKEQVAKFQAIAQKYQKELAPAAP